MFCRLVIWKTLQYTKENTCNGGIGFFITDASSNFTKILHTSLFLEHSKRLLLKRIKLYRINVRAYDAVFFSKVESLKELQTIIRRTPDVFSWILQGFFTRMVSGFFTKYFTGEFSNMLLKLIIILPIGLNTAQTKWSFPLWRYSVKVTKSDWKFTHIEDAQVVSWTSYVLSIKLLCPGVWSP